MKNYLNALGIILIFLLSLSNVLAQQNIESRLQALENEMSQLRQNNLIFFPLKISKRLNRNLIKPRKILMPVRISGG